VSRSPGNIAALPKWAQAEITRLERAVEYWQGVASVGPDESNTFANPFSDAPKPLGHDVTIEFVTTAGQKLRASLERDQVTGLYDRLEISGDGLLAVHPRAANVVWIKSVDR
jgi:hypothetical protein